MDERGFILGTTDEAKTICREKRRDAVFKQFKNRERLLQQTDKHLAPSSQRSLGYHNLTLTPSLHHKQ